MWLFCVSMLVFGVLSNPKVLWCDHCPDASLFGGFDLDATSDGATSAGCGNYLQKTFCWKAPGGVICARVDQLPLFPYNRGWSSTQ